MVIIGTRPEAIKLAPVVHALRERQHEVEVSICVTAQHREMLDQVLELFDIIPDTDLDLMRPGQSLSALAARVLTDLDPVLERHKPNWVIVQGDTTTVAMAAIAAQNRQIRVAHVEAGLRTRDRRNPFPEEMNRVVTDHISDLCFAPTETARQNLLAEGIPSQIIKVTGNTVIDSLTHMARKNWKPGPEHSFSRLPSSERWLLVTAHRRENFGEPLVQICTALRKLADNYHDGLHIVYPVHRNPQVWEPVHGQLSGHPRITLLPPVNYQELIFLMQNSYLILTDSGGLQEEAPSFDKPVLVMRETTERVEALSQGCIRLVGTSSDRIIKETVHLLSHADEYHRMAQAPNPYGDGYAAKRIVDLLLQTRTTI